MAETARAESPIACNLGAFDAGQRERHGALWDELRATVQEVGELPDGYTLRYASDPTTCLKVAEFITLERLCCPFVTFTLELEREQGPLWLRLTGREGVKDFLRAELGMGYKISGL